MKKRKQAFLKIAAFLGRKHKFISYEDDAMRNYIQNDAFKHAYNMSKCCNASSTPKLKSVLLN